jgi:hypothetical protein
MLIEKVVLMYSVKTATGYTAEVEMETSDGLGIGGSIEFDKDWNYKLGFLNTWENTDEDRYYVQEVLSSDDYKNDVMSFITS